MDQSNPPSPHTDYRLVQSSQTHYSLSDSGKRLTVDPRLVPTELTPGMFRRSVHFELPLFMTQDVWTRHGYTWRDIKRTIERYSAAHIWQKCLLDQRVVTASNTVATNAVKVSYATEDGLICGARAPGVKNIMSRLATTSPSLAQSSSVTEPTILRYTKCTHRPNLPVHDVDDDVWAMLQETLDSRRLVALSPPPPSEEEEDVADDSVSAKCRQRGDGDDHNERRQPPPPPPSYHPSANRLRYQYDRAVQWRDIVAVPFQQERRCIMLMTRIVPTDIYFQQCRQPTCMTQDPCRFVIDGLDYCATVESFYLYKQSSHSPHVVA